MKSINFFKLFFLISFCFISCKSQETKNIEMLNAAKNCDWTTVEKLIEQGANKNAVNLDDNHYSAVHYAIQKRDLEGLKMLVNHNVNLSIRDINMETPLALAVDITFDQAAKLLIENGCDVDVKRNDGLTPLLLAVAQNKTELVKLIAEKGANINYIHEETSMSALSLAVSSKNLEIVKCLVENGADVNIQGKNNYTPLMNAEDVNIAEYLISHGARLDCRTVENDEPLSIAASFGRTNIVKLMIKNGAAIESRNNLGATPLMCASISGHYDTMKVLIESGADVNAEAKNMTPISLAVDSEKNQDIRTIKLLLDNGAKVHNSNWFRTLSEVAEMHGKNDFANLLRKYE